MTFHYPVDFEFGSIIKSCSMVKVTNTKVAMMKRINLHRCNSIVLSKHLNAFSEHHCSDTIITIS